MLNLDKLTNVILLFTCAVVGGGAVYDRVWAPSHRKPLPSEAAWAGKRVALPVTLTRRTGVFVFVRPGCPACEHDMPLYRSLAQTPGRQFDVAIVGADREATRAYLAPYDVAPDFLVGAPLDRFGVVATPTVFLTDATGMVQRAWVGTIDGGPRKEEFLAALGNR